MKSYKIVCNYQNFSEKSNLLNCLRKVIILFKISQDPKFQSIKNLLNFKNHYKLIIF
jgi:hypothetical protein